MQSLFSSTDSHKGYGGAQQAIVASTTEYGCGAYRHRE